MLPTIALLGFHRCLATLVTSHNVTGANANLHHCHDIRDTRNLFLLPELPKAKSITLYGIELDTETKAEQRLFRSLLLHSQAYYSIQLPYLAFDCRYKIRFESATPERNSTCSTEFSASKREVLAQEETMAGEGVFVSDSLMEQSDWSDSTAPRQRTPTAADYTWQHTPNAAYPLALGVRRHGAYFVDPKSVWKIEQSESFPCSVVKYTAEIPFDDLRRCGALAVTSLANDTVRVGSHTIEIKLVTPNDENYGSNRITVHLYADKYDNFIRLVLMNGISLDTRVVVSSVALASMGIVEAKSDRLEFVLIVIAPLELQASMLQIHAMNDAGIELTLLETIGKLSDGTFSHRLNFSSDSTVGVLDEKLTIDIRTHKHTHHSEITSIVVDLFVTNPRAIETATTGELRPLLTNHVVLYNGRGLLERDAQIIDGSQVCMINNVVMPEEMSEIVAVRIAEAWLCIVAGSVGASTPTDKLQCESQRHMIQLFKDGKANQDLNVTVLTPGRLGPNSVELCFSTSLQITDRDLLTLQAPVQRYESRIELIPRTLLQGEPSLYASFAGASEIGGINARLRNHSSQQHAYSQYHIQRALKKVGHHNAEFHVRSVEFGVAPLIGTTHNMSMFVSNAVVIMVFVMFFCVIGIYVFLSAFDWQHVFRRPTFAEYYRK